MGNMNSRGKTSSTSSSKRDSKAKQIMQQDIGNKIIEKDPMIEKASNNWESTKCEFRE